jgi:hypothetical protein
MGILFDPRDVAELEQRLAVSLGWRQPPVDVVLRVLLDVSLYVSIQVCQRAPATSESEKVSACHGVLLLSGRSQDPADGSSQLVPFARFDLQLLPALRRQFVELRPPIVLGCAVIEGNPPAFDEAMQGRIEGALFHLQHVIRAMLDGLGNGMAVRRAEPKDP